MIGERVKYYDGEDESTIIEFDSLVCDCCKIRHEFYVGSMFAIPPAGLIINNGEIFICSDCIKNSYFYDNSLYNILSQYEEKVAENDIFIKELFRSIKDYLPNIFKLKRKVLPTKLRQQILKRYGYKCVHCGGDKNLTIDHIKPYSKNGSDEEHNLQVLCRSCNSKKGNRQSEK